MFSIRFLFSKNVPLKQTLRSISFFKKSGSDSVVDVKKLSEEAKAKESNVELPTTSVTTDNLCTVPVRKLAFPSPSQDPRQAWVLNLDTVDEVHSGIIDLHPAVFAERPRIDLIHENVEWQLKYKYVSWRNAPVMHEIQRSSRKPWPQKGTGRARHGTRRSPLWFKGGRCHPPRAPTTHFYMLPFTKRVRGLCSALSVKLAQDDLHIVRDLEIPSNSADYMIDLVEHRKWGPSVLFVDVVDIMPKNITIATDTIPHINLMPAYGLNVFSILKYDTVILTLAAAERIEEKLLAALNGVFTCNSKFSN